MSAAYWVVIGRQEPIYWATFCRYTKEFFSESPWGKDIALVADFADHRSAMGYARELNAMAGVIDRNDDLA